MYKILFLIGFVPLLMYAPYGYASYQEGNVIILNNGKVMFYGTTGETESFTDSPMEPQSVQIKNKNPVIAFALSAFIFPGAALGQFYNGQYIKGGVFFVIAGTGMMMAITNANLLGDGWSCVDCNESVGLAGALIFLGSWVGSFIDAPISANRINRQNQQVNISFNVRVVRRSVGPYMSYRF